jgi:hypothetical protein
MPAGSALSGQGSAEPAAKVVMNPIKCCRLALVSLVNVSFIPPWWLALSRSPGGLDWMFIFAVWFLVSFLCPESIGNFFVKRGFFCPTSFASTLDAAMLDFPQSEVECPLTRP